MKLLKLISRLLFCFVYNIVHADSFDDGYRTSLAVEANLKPISLEKFLIRFEQENYVANGASSWYQSLYRVALGYHLTDNAVLMLGYDYLPTHNFGSAFVGQQNVWPGFRYTMPLSLEPLYLGQCWNQILLAAM